MRAIILPFALLLVVPSASYAAECSEAVAAAAAVQLASCATLVGFTVEAPLTATQTTRICATCTLLADATKRKTFGDCTVVDTKTSTTMMLQTKFDALFVCPSTSLPSSSGSGSVEIETPVPATKTPTPTPTSIVSSSSGSGSAMPPVPTIIETLSPGSDGESQSSSGSFSPNLNSSSSSRGNGGTSSGSGSRNETTPINSSVIGSTISIGMVIGIAGGVVVLVILIATFIVCRQRRQHKKSRATMLGDLLLLSSLSEEDESRSGPSKPFTFAHSPSALNETFLAPPSHGGLWDDEAIIAVRIPREKVLSHALVSRGGYGEVYRGMYNDQPVAIKTLLPETRKNMKQISAFLAEIKLIASLEHERIVRFIGVAWDSLTDLCVVSEFMEGGDLRALLVKFEDVDHRPHGFDDDKIRIAIHIAHALTYLHSLQPIVLHRDLKSKNILLDTRLNAKLTDFGVSRERSDRTMTAGVGSSLWMAPEVMLGERYDDKADVFSFGIVLSELDSHQLPYENVKESGSVHRRIPDTAVLQMVSLGRLRVQFSKHALPEMVQLAHVCVALDPADRPTAADLLYKLHNILRASQESHIADLLPDSPGEAIDRFK